MINENIMIDYEKSGSLMNKVMRDNTLCSTNQITKRVETALYNYPMWKVNLEQLQAQHRGNRTESKDILDNRMEQLGVRRLDYISHVNLIEATMAALNPLQQAFIRQRYFKKTPFKIIAEELAVTERHLYRIRQQIIRLFETSFGWL